MAEATSLREKEAGVFAGQKAEYDQNIAAISKAPLRCLYDAFTARTVIEDAS
jgi:hypothetical protein